MIVLTENAATRIEQIRSEVADDSKYLRLSVKTGGCSGLEYGMSFDYKKDDDVVEESQNIKFIIDVKSMVHLDGCRGCRLHRGGCWCGHCDRADAGNPRPHVEGGKPTTNPVVALCRCGPDRRSLVLRYPGHAGVWRSVGGHSPPSCSGLHPGCRA